MSPANPKWWRIDRRLASADRTDLLFAGVLLIAAALLLYFNRVSWFYHDTWGFLAGRDTTDLGDLLRPHNEHWSLVPILVFRTLYAVFGIGSYWPYAVLLVVAHVLAAALVYVLLKRAGLPPLIRIPSSALLVVFGAGHEDMFWEFQVSFFGPVLILLGVLVILGGARGRRAYAVTAVLLVAAVMTSTVGVAVVAGVGVALLVGSGWRVASLVTAPATLLYGLWFTANREAVVGGAGESLVETLFDLPTVALTRIGVSATGVFGLPEAASWVLLVTVAAILLLAATSDAFPRFELLALLGTMAAFLLLVGLGRSDAVAVASRYRHLLALLLVPALGLLWVTIPTRRRTWAMVAGLATLMGLSVLTNIGLMRDAAGYWDPIRSAQREEVLASMALAAEGVDVVAVARPLSTRHHLDGNGVLALLESSKLEPPASGDFSREIREQQTVRLQNALVFGSVDMPPATVTFTSASGMELAATTETCLEFSATGLDPHVSGTLEAPGSIEVSSSVPGTIQVFRAEWFDFSQHGRIDIEAGAGSVVSLLTAGPDPHPTVRIDVPDGALLTLCGEQVSWEPSGGSSPGF